MDAEPLDPITSWVERPPEVLLHEPNGKSGADRAKWNAEEGLSWSTQMERVVEEHSGLSLVYPRDVRGMFKTLDWILKTVQWTAVDNDRTVGRAGKDVGVVTEPPACNRLPNLA